MTVIAIIPARGGSIGVPRKNVRSVGGVPLVGRAVVAARDAQSIDDVFVSTDDDVIASVATEFGAKIIRRPDHLASATSSSESALHHALGVFEDTGIQATYLVMLQCTSPFTTGIQIDCVVNALLASNARAAFSVVHDHGFLWRVGNDGLGYGVNHDHTQERQRRQSMEPQYRETGAIYAMNVKAFQSTGSRFCGAALPVCVDTPPLEIDEEADLIVAEALATLHATRASGT